MKEEQRGVGQQLEWRKGRIYMLLGSDILRRLSEKRSPMEARSRKSGVVVW
jgi:hypothetical protein